MKFVNSPNSWCRLRALSRHHRAQTSLDKFLWCLADQGTFDGITVPPLALHDGPAKVSTSNLFPFRTYIFCLRWFWGFHLIGCVNVKLLHLRCVMCTTVSPLMSRPQIAYFTLPTCLGILHQRNSSAESRDLACLRDLHRHWTYWTVNVTHKFDINTHYIYIYIYCVYVYIYIII